jgi:hypothetical protein
MTITAVAGQEGGTNADNTTAITRAFGSNVTAGNLIVVVAPVFASSAHTFVAGDCTKSAGTATLGTIALDAEFHGNDGNPSAPYAIGIWSALVTGSGSCTMQVAGLAAGSFLLIATGEYASDVGWGASRVDGTPATKQNQTDGSLAADTGSMTSTAGGLFMAGVQINSTAAVTIVKDLNLTQIYNNDGSVNDCGNVSRRIVSSSTAYNPSWTLTNAHNGWCSAGVIYKETAASGAVLRKNSLLRLGVGR